MGNCASGPKIKEGAAPDPAPAEEEAVLEGTEKTETETEKKVEDREVVVIKTDGEPKHATDENGLSLGHSLDSAEEAKAEVEEEKEEHIEAVAEAVVENQPKTAEVKNGEAKESSSEAVTPAEPAKEEVEKEE